MPRFAIKVTWRDGSEEYLKQGDDTTVFASRGRAQEQLDFMRIGMDGDPGVQSMAVVRAPQRGT